MSEISINVSEGLDDLDLSGFWLSFDPWKIFDEMDEAVKSLEESVDKLKKKIPPKEAEGLKNKIQEAFDEVVTAKEKTIEEFDKKRDELEQKKQKLEKEKNKKEQELVEKTEELNLFNEDIKYKVKQTWKLRALAESLTKYQEWTKSEEVEKLKQKIKEIEKNIQQIEENKNKKKELVVEKNNLEQNKQKLATDIQKLAEDLWKDVFGNVYDLWKDSKNKLKDKYRGLLSNNKFDEIKKNINKFSLNSAVYDNLELNNIVDKLFEQGNLKIDDLNFDYLKKNRLLDNVQVEGDKKDDFVKNLKELYKLKKDFKKDLQEEIQNIWISDDKKKEFFEFFWNYKIYQWLNEQIKNKNVEINRIQVNKDEFQKQLKELADKYEEQQQSYINDIATKILEILDVEQVEDKEIKKLLKNIKELREQIREIEKKIEGLDKIDKALQAKYKELQNNLNKSLTKLIDMWLLPQNVSKELQEVLNKDLSDVAKEKFKEDKERVSREVSERSYLKNLSVELSENYDPSMKEIKEAVDQLKSNEKNLKKSVLEEFGKKTLKLENKLNKNKEYENLKELSDKLANNELQLFDFGNYAFNNNNLEQIFEWKFKFLENLKNSPNIYNLEDYDREGLKDFYMLIKLAQDWLLDNELLEILNKLLLEVSDKSRLLKNVIDNLEKTKKGIIEKLWDIKKFSKKIDNYSIDIFEENSLNEEINKKWWVLYTGLINESKKIKILDRINNSKEYDVKIGLTNFKVDFDKNEGIKLYKDWRKLSLDSYNNKKTFIKVIKSLIGNLKNKKKIGKNVIWNYENFEIKLNEMQDLLDLKDKYSSAVNDSESKNYEYKNEIKGFKEINDVIWVINRKYENYKNTCIKIEKKLWKIQQEVESLNSEEFYKKLKLQKEKKNWEWWEKLTYKVVYSYLIDNNDKIEGWFKLESPEIFQYVKTNKFKTKQLWTEDKKYYYDIVKKK